MTDEERQKLCAWRHDVDSVLETAADLLERLAHELVATNERLVQLEARVEALERM
jgi:hypothetical protein